MTSNLTYATIDEPLGPPEGRFFAAGYRQTERAVNQLRIEAGAISAKAALRYRRNWSVKASGSPRPHLSSIDATALAIDLVEAHLTHGRGLSLGERGRCWLRSCEMRVRTPLEDLDEFMVSAVLVASAPVDGGDDTWRSAFDFQVGTISGACVVEHPAGRPRSDGASFDTAADVLGAPDRRFHGERYKLRTHRVEDVRLEADRSSVRATVTVHDPGAHATDDSGFGAAYHPSLAMVDSIVVLAQLTQAMTYELDGLQRAASNTFWMRRLAMWRDTPIDPLDAPLDASVAITQTARQQLHGNPWRTLDVRGRIAGIRVTAAVAHQLPTGIAGPLL